MTEEAPWTYLMDMDGVLVHEEHMVPGADKFLAELREHGLPFMVFTNNSIYTPRDLRARLHRTGLDIPESAIWTSALATAPVAGSVPSLLGPFSSGLVAMNRAPPSTSRIALVIASKL